MQYLKKSSINLLLAVSLSLLIFNANAFPDESLVPGGIAVLELKNHSAKTQIRFDGKKVAVVKHNRKWYAIAGIPINAKTGGNHRFTLKKSNGITDVISINISAKEYKSQYLTVEKKHSNPSPTDLRRIKKEKGRKNRATEFWSKSMPDIGFVWPVKGRISSTYGLRRFFNEQPRKPHTGLDIVAPFGSPVLAVSGGTVIEAGNFFFSGNLVYIDHGQGIISIYAHLNSIYVKPGDVIKQGDIIGALGKSGRATGPHLHFAVMANQAQIDPGIFLPR